MREEPVEKSMTIAVDLAKSVFEIAISKEPGRVRQRRRLTRSQMARLQSRPPLIDSNAAPPPPWQRPAYGKNLLREESRYSVTSQGFVASQVALGTRQAVRRQAGGGRGWCPEKVNPRSPPACPLPAPVSWPDRTIAQPRREPRAVSRKPLSGTRLEPVGGAAENNVWLVPRIRLLYFVEERDGAEPSGKRGPVDPGSVFLERLPSVMVV
jgi:hypothetical protein